MAERSYLWPTTGTGDGPSGGYPYTQIAEMMGALYSSGVLGGLGISVSGFNATVAPGSAMTQGVLYTNDAPLNLSIINPGSGNTRRDLIVLRGNASTRTVRAAIKTGIPNSGAYPTLQQDASYPASGVYEIQLARLVVTATGAVLDGEAQMAAPRGLAGTSQIADAAVTGPKIADGAVSAAKLGDNAVTTSKIANGAVTSPKLAFAAAAADRRLATGWVTETALQRIARGQITVNMSSGETNKLVTQSLAGVFPGGAIIHAYAQVFAPGSADFVWVSDHGWWDVANSIYSFTVRRTATAAAGYLLSFVLIGAA